MPTAAAFDTIDISTPGYYGSSQTALLLLDFHSLFVGQLTAPTALGTAVKMRIWAKSQGIQVIHCVMNLDATPFQTCKDSDRLASIVASIKSGGGEEPNELLENMGDDVTFTRRPGYVSALKSPGLEEFLQGKGIKSLVLAGLSTSGCVMRTAFAASDAEYVVTVISDGCADPAEGVHDMMVEKILNNRGYVTTAAEFQEGF